MKIKHYRNVTGDNVRLSNLHSRETTNYHIVRKRSKFFVA